MNRGVGEELRQGRLKRGGFVGLMLREVHMAMVAQVHVRTSSLSVLGHVL